MNAQQLYFKDGMVLFIMQPFEAGVHSLHETIRKTTRPAIREIDSTRKAIRSHQASECPDCGAIKLRHKDPCWDCVAERRRRGGWAALIDGGYRRITHEVK